MVRMGWGILDITDSVYAEFGISQFWSRTKLGLWLRLLEPGDGRSGIHESRVCEPQLQRLWLRGLVAASDVRCPAVQLLVVASAERLSVLDSTTGPIIRRVGLRVRPYVAGPDSLSIERDSGLATGNGVAGRRHCCLGRPVSTGWDNWRFYFHPVHRATTLSGHPAIARVSFTVLPLTRALILNVGCTPIEDSGRATCPFA